MLNRLSPVRKNKKKSPIKRKSVVNQINPRIHVKAVTKINTLNDNIQADDDYLKETLAELGIDLNKPRKKSRLPRNKNGLPVMRGGAGKDMLTMYREEKGRC